MCACWLRPPWGCVACTRALTHVARLNARQVGVLEEVAKRQGFKLVFKEALIGGAALDAVNDPFPDESLKA